MTPYLLAYLWVGLLNYALFAAQGQAMLFMAGARLEGLVEAAFFILVWPGQAAFWLFTRLLLPLLAWLAARLKG